jgi:hypothetical protein
MSNGSIKRRFWQIHLSTAVMLMFVAGLGIYANFNYSHEITSGTGFTGSEIWSTVGLPLDCMTKVDKVERKPDGSRFVCNMRN